jgi:uncharacterized protein YndB with AHSA1/START domain
MTEMHLDLTVDAFYPHPREVVWAALIDAKALATWLLENNFEPHVGSEFTLRGPDIGEIRCTVLVLDPPRRMEWRWQSSTFSGPTRVVFSLEVAEGGTRLTVRHDGPTRLEHREAISGGWPKKLGVLAAWLDRSVTNPPAV